jgi:hypothetical protein
VSDERLLVPIDDPYLHAVGLAVTCFARLEWGVVWVCEKLNPGYLTEMKRKTAGGIASDFIRLTAAYSAPGTAADLSRVAYEFSYLVGTRNKLLHAKPGTNSSTQEQRLFSEGTEWTVAAVNHAADRFVDLETRIVAMYHNVLRESLGHVHSHPCRLHRAIQLCRSLPGRSGVRHRVPGV